MLRNALIGFLAASALVACSPVEISTDHSSRVDFGSLKTYAWYSNEINISQDSKQQLDASLDQLIRSEIDASLAAKGYTLGDPGAVDFLVNYVVSAKTRIDLKTYHTYSGNSPDLVFTREDGIQFGKLEASETDHYEYREGTFLIDVIDPATDKMMWRGIAEKRIDKELTEEQRAAGVSKAVRRLLSEFPPG